MSRTIPLRADLDYLLAPPNAWWRWSADGRWIEWRDGRTIAAREELRAALDRLAPRGLPPLGAVLLLLAATRSGWDAAKSGHEITNATLTLDPGGGPGGGTVGATLLDGAAARQLRADVADVVGDLAAIAALPASLREPIAAKAALAAYIFLDARAALPPAAADGVLALLAEGFDADASGGDADAVRRSELELSTLRPGLARAQAGNLSRWVQTGLDALVGPADVAVPLARQVRTLLGELREDVELGAMARLASQVLAAVHVPRDLRSREALPLGGVSDIANRGSFDRLLVSELAHDPLTLAVRVAMNEALYLRREAPAAHPPVTRTVMIDGGIRMWGVPRLYGCAVAMALAASAAPGDPCRVLRTHAKTTTPVDLTTRDGLTAHLARLDPWPDPLDALLAYANASSIAVPTPTAAAEEVFLIVERGTFAEQAFWRRTAPLLDRLTLYVASVAADGAFELVLPTPLGRRRVASARLELAPLLEDQSRAAAGRIVARDQSLPAILQLREFPLRLPARVDPRFAAVGASGSLVGLTRDRRLMQWTGEHLGARPLLETLPHGDVRGVFAEPDRGVAHVCVTHRKANRLVIVTVDLQTGRHEDAEYAAGHPLAVAFVRGAFLLLYRRGFSVLRPGGGDVRPHSVPTGATWSSGRFYRNWGDRSLFVAAENGAVMLRAKFDGLLAFERVGSGPWALQRGWTFGAIDARETVSPQYGETPRRDAPPSKFVPSVDGDRVLLVGGTAGKRFRATGVDLTTADVETFCHQDAAYGFLVGKSVRWGLDAGIDALKAFGAIGVDADGHLVLRTGRVRGRPVVLRIHAHGRLRADRAEREVPLRAVREFSRCRRVPDAAYRLREASWPNGSRAWLDSRGMLHLKSDLSSKAEITCVLASNGGLGGWTSDGQTFGWRFFLGGEPTLTDAHAAALLRSFAERLT